MFKKILVANRGEIAIRVIRSCRELGIQVVAVYSEADRESLHVGLADEACCLGPAAPLESYLAAEPILEAARRSGAEAIHPGYGFLSENPAFAEQCQQAGLCFIGPPVGAMRLMGDKLKSRQVALQAGVPVVPGSKGVVHSAAQASELAQSLGYPVMLKARAGGGGKGLRLVRDPSQLQSVFQLASQEAAAAFADPGLYLEKYLEAPRHVEVQILGDGQGHLIHLGERECSLQRRHQKLLEETPSPVVGTALRRRLGEAALAVARAAGYQNAGTVEFLLEGADLEEPRFYFLEMNTRLQVEHPVTEAVTGMDLVALQIELAAGRELRFSQEAVQRRGAAMECRIYAEDPANHFAPSPGRITTWVEPAGPGVRNDSGVRQGSLVPLEYDPLISKLITWGKDRQEAIRRMRRALSEYRVGGIHTTLPLFQTLLQNRDFVRGHFDTHFLEKVESVPPEHHPDRLVAPLLAAALEYRSSRERPVSQSSRPDRWRAWDRFPNARHNR